MTILQRINKIWRVFITGFCFVLFAAGGLLLTFIVFPVLTFSIKDKLARELKVQKTIQRAFSFFCTTMRLTGCIDYQFIGQEILQKDKNCLIVANHPSLIDYVLIASRLQQCDCLVKQAIWHNPFMKGVVKSAGYISNKNPQTLLDDCSQRLQQGNVLLVFPEGTRTTPGLKPTLQRGAAQIAVKTATDLRVVHISVTPPFLTKEKKWYQVADTKPFFLIEIKDKIEIAPFIENSQPPSIAVRSLNKHLATALFPSLNNNE
ncbi:lysophospholipid acyltransferase family protein [Psychromonas sp.]|uniref:lysophospholipid acyltransferase family protein n=1 Tax=Psychromonas sp. TaxID=1884585 RepID=UPI0039E4A0D9